jgi:hypothetical protein
MDEAAAQEPDMGLTDVAGGHLDAEFVEHRENVDQSLPELLVSSVHVLRHEHTSATLFYDLFLNNLQCKVDLPVQAIGRECNDDVDLSALKCPKHRGKPVTPAAAPGLGGIEENVALIYVNVVAFGPCATRADLVLNAVLEAS